MVMHKNLEGPAVFEMLNKALEFACREKRVVEERNIKILIAQMHVVKVNTFWLYLLCADIDNVSILLLSITILLTYLHTFD